MAWGPIISGGGSVAKATFNKTRSMVANRGRWYIAGTTAGTTTGYTYRSRHVASADCSQIQLVYGNPTTNVLNVTASIEDQTSNIHPLTFGGGQQQVTMPANDANYRNLSVLVSDPLPIYIPKGTTFYVRTFVSTASTSDTIPVGLGLYDLTYNGNANQEGSVSGDQTGNSGSITGLTTAYGFTPIAIVGEISSPQPSIVIYGDSISCGAYDVDPITGQSGDYGFIVRALESAGISYSLNGWGGEKVSIVQHGTIRHLPDQYATHAVVNYGINDIANNESLSTIQNDLVAFWKYLAASGIKVYACTLTPWTTSTDNWATTANQTPEANTGPNSTRTQLNDWIRTTPAPLSGYFEMADVVETSRNSGIWQVGYTDGNGANGLHPNPAGNAAMAAAIPTSVFQSY